MPASSHILSCNHGILSSTSYLPAARFCFPQETPLFVENRSDSFQAIPHNSKCRYGERGVADAKPKAQIILDAAKVSAASGGNSEPKQGQGSESARGFCPRSTMRVPQPDIIEHFGNADTVPQPPERCLSRKAGIVRCCLHFFPVVTRSAFLFLPTNCPCSRKVYRNFQLFHALFIRSSFLFFMIESIGGPYYRPQLEELLCTKPNSRATPKRRPALYMP